MEKISITVLVLVTMFLGTYIYTANTVCLYVAAGIFAIYTFFWVCIIISWIYVLREVMIIFAKEFNKFFLPDENERM